MAMSHHIILLFMVKKAQETFPIVAHLNLAVTGSLTYPLYYSKVTKYTASLFNI